MVSLTVAARLIKDQIEAASLIRNVGMKVPSQRSKDFSCSASK